jgi:1-deoxy-D-xylulose-5-phosphate reductoisomerase
MVKYVSILGSTGSIGRQSLDIISRLPQVKVSALTAGTSVERMAQQCRDFMPELAVMATQESAMQLSEMIKDLPIRVSWGEEGLIEAAVIPNADCVITAVVGMAMSGMFRP